MSNIRKLKKEVDNLVFEVISDCMTFGSVHPEKTPEEVNSILYEAVDLRNDLIRRINHPEAHDDPKKRKAHFQNIVKDLYSGSDRLLERLSQLAGKE
jgi:hypothetical protein